MTDTFYPPHICSKKLFLAVHNFVHLNLATALFIGYLTFALGVELAHKHEVKWRCLVDVLIMVLSSLDCL